MPVELFTFSKGLNARKNPLMLEDGELFTASNIRYALDGQVSCRTPKSAVSTIAVGTINGLFRYINYVMLGDGENVRWKWDLDGYCGLYVPPDENFTLLGTLGGSQRHRYASYGDQIFIANGNKGKVFDNGNFYDWAIPAPTIAPRGAAGSGGSPNGTYSLYYTYHITFPSGITHETAPSPAGSVTVSGTNIAWRSVAPCPYSGSGVVIHRKLYRYSTALGEIYYVTTIANNTATGITDPYSDATLQANDILDTESYSPIPDGFVDICEWLERIFGIKGNSLYYTEPYLPFTTTLTNQIEIAKSGVDLVGIIPWGDQLYIAEPGTWKRLQGLTSATWQVRKTYADRGIIGTYTLKATPYGLLGLWYDGLYLFDGTTSKSITTGKIQDSTFTSITSPKSCYAEWDGFRYYFFYPSTGTTIDSCLVADFRKYPKIEFYNEDFLATAYCFHKETGIKYYGKSGLHYGEGTSEVILMSLQTGDRSMKDIIQEKIPTYLYYDINTGGKDVTVTFYANGVAQSPTVTLNTAVRERGRIEDIGAFRGYYFSVGISCLDAKDVVIYEPWAVNFDIVGV